MSTECEELLEKSFDTAPAHANIGRLNEDMKHSYKARLDTIWKAHP
jgi:hypothetical protein